MYKKKENNAKLLATENQEDRGSLSLCHFLLSATENNKQTQATLTLTTLLHAKYRMKYVTISASKLYRIKIAI